MHVEEKWAEYRVLSAAIAQPAVEDEPVVTDMFFRADGRRIFRVRFHWGIARIQKEVYLLSIGGPPVYQGMSRITGAPPENEDLNRVERLAAIAALRFESRLP